MVSIFFNIHIKFLPLIYSSRTDKSVSDVRLTEIFLSSIITPSFPLPIQEKHSNTEFWFKFFLGQVTSHSLGTNSLCTHHSMSFDNHSNYMVSFQKFHLLRWLGPKVEDRNVVYGDRVCLPSWYPSAREEPEIRGSEQHCLPPCQDWWSRLVTELLTAESQGGCLIFFFFSLNHMLEKLSAIL